MDKSCLTFYLYTGMSFSQYGYTEKNAKEVVSKFVKAKQNPEQSQVLLFEPPDGIGSSLAIDLKNIIGVSHT